ncbi:MAG: class I SAM-dependent methyltransferase [Bacteroidia bacterium]|nr:class I SAM-dependent methyltransferase [Bacteroidia bacterium]
MNWQAYWDRLAGLDDPHAQVARTVQGHTPGPDLLPRIAAHLLGLLEPRPQHRLLDVCCGNGALTRLLAPHVREIWGVDLSPAQIARAQAAGPPDIQYRCGDAVRLREAVEGPFDRISLYFSFQYLDTPAKARQAFRELAALLAPDGLLLIGDVPDRARLGVFYPRWQARLRYHADLRLGRSPMGRFWSAAALIRMAGAAGLELQAVPQPPDLPYAAYRSDYLGRLRR